MPPLDKECRVYWIRKPEHTDMFSQGYIGITTGSLHNRLVAHKSTARKGATSIIAKALRKYDDLLCNEIVIGPLWYCLDLERQLRPLPGIGYNSDVGGKIGRQEVPTKESTRLKLSEAVKKAYVLDPTLVERTGRKNKGKKHSEQTKAKLRLIERPSAWNNGASLVSTWIRAREVYDYVQLHNCGHVKVAIHLGEPNWTFASLVRKIKSGWNPYLCPEWQEFYYKNTKEI